jgi:hypothetical protein
MLNDLNEPEVIRKPKIQEWQKRDSAFAILVFLMDKVLHINVFLSLHD